VKGQGRFVHSLLLPGRSVYRRQSQTHLKSTQWEEKRQWAQAGSKDIKKKREKLFTMKAVKHCSSGPGRLWDLCLGDVQNASTASITLL